MHFSLTHLGSLLEAKLTGVAMNSDAVNKPYTNQKRAVSASRTGRPKQESLSYGLHRKLDSSKGTAWLTLTPA